MAHTFVNLAQGQTYTGAPTFLDTITTEPTIDISAASGEDLQLRMGDAIGANKIAFLDSASAEVWSVNSDGDELITQGVHTTGSPNALKVTGAAHTTLAASTNAPDVYFDLARTVQFETSANNFQTGVFLTAPTFSYVGASTPLVAGTLAIAGSPTEGTNATFTVSAALVIGEVGGVRPNNSSNSIIILPEGISDGIGNVSGRGCLSFVAPGAISLGDQTANLGVWDTVSFNSIALSSDTNTRTITSRASTVFIGGPPTNGGNVAFPAIGAKALHINNAACYFDVDDTEEIQIVVKSSGYTGTNGVVNVDFDYSADSAKCFAVNMDGTGSHDDVSAYWVGVQGYNAGGTDGDVVSGFRGKVTTNAGDNNVNYKVFHAFDAADNGGTNVLTGLEVGSNYDRAIQFDSGAFIGSTDSITATDAGVAASLTSLTTKITTNGDTDTDNATLADGVNGQVKHFIVVAVGNAGDSVKVTPTNMVGGTQITFAANPLGLGCTMVFDGTNWCVVANNGGVIA